MKLTPTQRNVLLAIIDGRRSRATKPNDVQILDAYTDSVWFHLFEVGALEWAGPAKFRVTPIGVDAAREKLSTI